MEKSEAKKINLQIESRRAVWRFVVLPFLFLSVVLLGGLRLSLETNAFLFVRPSLIMLVCAAILLILLWRGKILPVEKWFSEELPILENISNTLILLVLFAATTQIFNSVLPENGLFFWIFSLFFLWTLWNNLFADFSPQKLLASLAGMFGMAFIFKHLILSAMSFPGNESWFKKLAENALQEVSFGVFSANKFSPASGYVAFFALIIYLLGLLILLPKNEKRDEPK